MNKKRILPLLLASCLAFSLSGCVNKQNDNKDVIAQTIEKLLQEAAAESTETATEEAAEPVSETAETIPEDTKETEPEEAASVPEETSETGPEDAAGTVPVNIPEDRLSEGALTFQTTDLFNEKTTSDIFSDYDITVLHVWGTYCGPCIEEMGSYAAFYETLPENVNLVGIVCDVYDGMDMNLDSAFEILNDAGATFTNLRLNEDLYELMDNIRFIPSSLLVNREGRVIGPILEGEHFEATEETLNEYIG